MPCVERKSFAKPVNTRVASMRTLASIIVLLVFALTPLTVSAQIVDAPTGTYKGTLVHERTLTWKQVDPRRVVSYKAKTKVTGFGFVPVGAARTLIKLIVPPQAFRDAGLDNGFELDFDKIPPEVRILDGTSTVTFPSPTTTVEGTLVTIVTTVSGNTADYEIADVRTLTLKRSKP
jgi:hypothetical protein